MNVTFEDLSRKSREVLQALDRNERVTVLHRGRPKAVIHAYVQIDGSGGKVAEHPAFGMWKNRAELSMPSDHVRGLRSDRGRKF